MLITILYLFFDIYYKLDFEITIRGHHVYQSKWTSELNRKFKCAIDSRDEPVKYDENTINIYLCDKERREAGIVGHLPVKISKLTKQFQKADKNNLTNVFGKRKRKIGLVIAAKYSAMKMKKT